MSNKSPEQYWKRNIRLVLILMAIWALVSFGFGIVLAEPLNAIKIGGFKLGFWFAQQGSIYVFVLIIFYYVWKMNQLDKEFNVDEQ
jgi:putative solute:sodium symporter small subunit